MSQTNKSDTNGYVTRNLGCVPGTSTPLKPAPYSITLQADGKVVVAGATTASGSSVPGYDNMFAMRFMHEQDGKGNIVDSGFNSGAEKLVAFSAGSGSASGAYAAAIDTDGSISMAGWAKSTACGPSSFAVARLTSSGSLDTTFDADGKLTTTFTYCGCGGGTYTSVITGAAITADGKFIVGGYVTPSGSSTGDFAVARYNSPSGLEQRLFVIQDANHNVTAVTDAFGNVVERYEYDPHGLRTIYSSTYSVRGSSSYSFVNGFQGFAHDTVTGWLYARNRWLIASLQTWNRMDPIGYPDGLNGYLVLRNKPIDSVDPCGLATLKVVIPHKVEVSDNWGEPFHARTAKQIGERLVDLGDYGAATDPVFTKPRRSVEYHKEPCLNGQRTLIVVDELIIEMTLIDRVRIPKWLDHATAPPWLRDRWDKWRQRAIDHEMGHVLSDQTAAALVRLSQYDVGPIEFTVENDATPEQIQKIITERVNEMKLVDQIQRLVDTVSSLGHGLVDLLDTPWNVNDPE